jgi:hypothetical protein
MHQERQASGWLHDNAARRTEVIHTFYSHPTRQQWVCCFLQVTSHM